jgi:hypothetical protein
MNREDEGQAHDLLSGSPPEKMRNIETEREFSPNPSILIF